MIGGWVKNLISKRRQLLDIIKSYPLALSKLWVPFCHRFDGLGSKSPRKRGCGREMRMGSLSTYRCDHCDIEEVRTSQREAALRFSNVGEAFLCTGGNRAGKTQIGAMLSVACAAGRNEQWVSDWLILNDLPLNLVPEKPSSVWCASLSYKDGLEYLRPKLDQYLPEGTKKIRWNSQDRAVATLPNGGRIVSMSCDSGRWSWNWKGGKKLESAHKKGFKEYGVDVPDSIASQKNKLILLDPKEDSFFFQGASIEDGGSGLVSTANDYLKFATMLLNKGSFNGKRILNPETVEIMTSNQVEKKAKPYKFDAFGFGVTVGVALNSKKMRMKRGDNSYFWGGAARTLFWVDPENDLVFVNMSQVLGSPRINNKVEKLVYKALGI